MSLDPMALFAVLLVAATGTILFLSSDWRLSIILLALQYVGVFVLVALEWPFGMAVVKLLAGWIAGAVLGMAINSIPTLRADMSSDAASAAMRLTINRPFYLLASLLVGIVVISQANHIVEWIPSIRIEQAWGGLLLIGMGLLKLGFTLRPLPTILGLLTALSGFETIYASIERSTLLAGLLAGISLGLALIGAYLMVAPYMEPDE